MSEPAIDTTIDSSMRAFLFGVRTAATSVFGVVIMVTYLGFGALAHDYGFSALWAMASTLVIWAGPAQVLLVSTLGSGTAAFEVALAVGLSSVRLLPMVVSLLPIVRDERSRPLPMIFAVHFWAVSVWVEATRVAPQVPREHRIAFCNGIGVTLTLVGTLSTGAGYGLQAVLPALFAAAAMFVTPISFLVSAARNARLLIEKLALGFGLALAPALAFAKVDYDLLWTGILGGTGAYLVHRLRRARTVT